MNKFIFISILISACLINACGSKTENSNNSNNSASTNTNAVQSAGGNSLVNDTKNVNTNAEKAVQKSDGIESIYTDLKADKCKTTSSNADEEWSVQECPGVSVYKLEVTEGDLRQSINVLSESGKKWELDFSVNVSSAFSAFGDKAEWRVKKENGKITPIALITRYNVNEDTEKPEKLTSYLVVTKFEDELVCITDVVKPIPNANEKARELADNSRGKPCLQAK